TAIVICAWPAFAQEPPDRRGGPSGPPEDTRTQYPAFLQNSFFSINAGAISYNFSQDQLEPGFRATSIAIPHVVARVALFGHEFNRFIAVQGTYMRPVKYVSYN